MITFMQSKRLLEIGQVVALLSHLAKPTLAAAGVFARPSFVATSRTTSTATTSRSSAWGYLELRGGGAETNAENESPQYGRIWNDEYRLAPEQIERFHREGCITIENVLTEEEVAAIQQVFDGFIQGDIPPPPGKDFCDISKPFGIPFEEWSLINCMLPTLYYPPFQGNVFERLATSMAKQLFPSSDMVKDYDQFLNKRPGKHDAVFAWHQDMAYWPGTKALGVDCTDTCTFSLAIDDSDEANGCLRYVVGSGASKSLRTHQPLSGSRDEGHALTLQLDEDKEDIRLAPAKRGSITIHDEWVVHGSGGNTCENRQRRTYVVAFRAKEIVDAERRLGFTHSHNDEANWDTFSDGASHRVKKNAEEKSQEM